MEIFKNIITPLEGRRKNIMKKKKKFVFSPHDSEYINRYRDKGVEDYLKGHSDEWVRSDIYKCLKCIDYTLRIDEELKFIDKSIKYIDTISQKIKEVYMVKGIKPPDVYKKRDELSIILRDIRTKTELKDLIKTSGFLSDDVHYTHILNYEFHKMSHEERKQITKEIVDKMNKNKNKS